MGGFTITKKKGTGLIGLYSGRKIKAMAAKGERLTPKQTAKQALRAIERKYAKQGGIVDSAKYYHAGGGNWVRRSKDADRKRTGKVTTDVKKWRRQPHKFDLRGVDTKGSRVTKPKKKVKPLPNYNRIATEFKNEVTKVLKSQNASSIKVGASIKEFKPGDGTTYHTITYTISYENGYPTHEVYSKVDAIEKKFREKHKEAKLLYDRKSVNRTFSKAVSNFALNAWRQENPNSSIETAKKRALRDMLDYKLTQAVLKDILSDPLSKSIQDVPKKASVKPVRYTKTTRKMRYDASVYDLASDYKYRGAKRAGDAYSLFVKDRMLKPEISVKEFKKVFDVVSPAKFRESKTVTKQVKLTPSMLKAQPPKRRGGKGPKPKTALKGKPLGGRKPRTQKPTQKKKPVYKPTKQHREWVNQFKSVVTGKLQAMGARKIKFMISGPYNMTDYRASVIYEAGPNTDIARIKTDDAAHGLSKLTDPYFSIVQWKDPVRTLPAYIETYAKNKYLKVFVDIGKPFKNTEVEKQAAGYLDRTDFSLAEQRKMKNSPMSKKTFTNSLMKKTGRI